MSALLPTDQAAMKACCLGAVVAAVVAGAVAQYCPKLASNLPSGAVRNLYMCPWKFALVIGVLVLVVTGLMHMGTRSTSDYLFYANLLQPETYGYGGLAPSSGSLNKKVQFKNFMA